MTVKPIAVFQHTEVGAPGTVVPILQSLGREVHIVRIVDGDAVPTDASAFGGLVFMGGYMGANDPLPWIAQELALIRAAAAQGIPVAGHCLGSQLVARALGGSVHTHARPEIGWNDIVADDHALARDWWGDAAGQTLETFQWHGDTFTPPPGAVRIATGVHCAAQARRAWRGLDSPSRVHPPRPRAASPTTDGRQLPQRAPPPKDPQGSA